MTGNKRKCKYFRKCGNVFEKFIIETGFNKGDYSRLCPDCRKHIEAGRRIKPRDDKGWVRQDMNEIRSAKHGN